MGDHHKLRSLGENRLYSVSDFARMAHPFSARQRYIAVFYAYFDESGDPRDVNNKVFTLSGLVASEKQWGKWEDSWNRILSRFKVSALHMKDFEHRHGEFKGWSKEHADRFISQLAAITKGNIEYGISLSLRVDHWRAYIKHQMVIPYEEARGPYIFLLNFCLTKIVEKATYLPQGEQIATFFEENNYVQAAAKSHYALLKQECGWDNVLLGCSFEPKDKFVPFQSADMVSYEGRKNIINQIERRSPRKLLRSLIASKRIDFMILDLAALLNKAAEIEQSGGSIG